jgi:hypothetical protein
MERFMVSLSSQRGARCSLSPRERAGVRGKRVPALSIDASDARGLLLQDDGNGAGRLQFQDEAPGAGRAPFPLIRPSATFSLGEKARVRCLH